MPKIDFLKVLHEFAIECRVTVTKGSRRKLAGDARLHLDVVVSRVTSFKDIQFEAFHCLSTWKYDEKSKKIFFKKLLPLLLTDQIWQPFTENDVLQFGNYDLPGFVEDSFVRPVAIQVTQDGSDTIMFTSECSVQSGQRNDLIIAMVA